MGTCSKWARQDQFSEQSSRHLNMLQRPDICKTLGQRERKWSSGRSRSSWVEGPGWIVSKQKNWRLTNRNSKWRSSSNKKILHRSSCSRARRHACTHSCGNCIAAITKTIRWWIVGMLKGNNSSWSEWLFRSFNRKRLLFFICWQSQIRKNIYLYDPGRQMSDTKYH